MLLYLYFAALYQKNFFNLFCFDVKRDFFSGFCKINLMVLFKCRSFNDMIIFSFLTEETDRKILKFNSSRKFPSLFT